MSKEGFLKDYVEVNVRIEKFYEKYPEGSIQTEITHLDDQKVIIKAYAYRNPEDPMPATGHAMEKEGSTYINKTSHVENCETSAVGRALAMLGFEVKKSVASREEMENAIHQQGTDNTPQKPRQTGNPARHNTQSSENIICEGCNKAITKSGSHTPEQIASYSNRLYGKPLCKACQKKVEAAKK